MAAISQIAASVLRSSINIGATAGVAKAGVTIVAGNVVYLDTATNTYGLADNTGATPIFIPAGIALGGAGPGQPFLFCPADTAFIPGGTMTQGLMIYLTTAGGITETVADLASAERVVPLGLAVTATTMNLVMPTVTVAKP